MTAEDWITARKQVEDLIGLEDYYRIERETVEKLRGARKRERRSTNARNRRIAS